MKKTISLMIFALIFMTGCVLDQSKISIENKDSQTIGKQVFKSKILAKIAPLSTSSDPVPYMKESKYIKILILPFENSENDIDYGGIIETKLEDSKFIFDDELKKKIINDSNSIGSI